MIYSAKALKSIITKHIIFIMLTLFVIPSQSNEGAKKINLGVSKLGIFDASIADTPAGQRAWMSYSAVNPSTRWPKKNTRSVSTRLAYSDDRGASWRDAGVVNEAKDVELSDPLRRSGTWINEVSSITYDQWDPTPNKWKLFWPHYLIVNQKSLFEHGWLAYKTASSPEGLKLAKEEKLFVGLGYQNVNDEDSDKTRSPLLDAPHIKIQKLNPALKNCVALSEPGAMSTPEGIYLALGCYESHFFGIETKIVLLKCGRPCDITKPSSWQYLSTLLTEKDAGHFNADAFSAADLFASGSSHYLIASPVTDQPVHGAYNGCMVFQFDSLEKGQLIKSDKWPKLIKRISGAPKTFNGACTYRPSAENAGFIYAELLLKEVPEFQLFMSGLRL